MLPAIVLPFTQDEQVSKAGLAGTVIAFSENDDVFNRGFVAAVIVQQVGVLKTSKVSLAQASGTSFMFFLAQ